MKFASHALAGLAGEHEHGYICGNFLIRARIESGTRRDPLFFIT